MSEFLRVRSAREGDPMHEFDASAAEVAARPQLYDVLDPVAVQAPRPVKYVVSVPAPAVTAHKPGGRTKKERANYGA